MAANEDILEGSQSLGTVYIRLNLDDAVVNTEIVAQKVLVRCGIRSLVAV